MGLVDDLLLPPVADRVRPAGAQDPAQPLSVSEQDTPAGDEVGEDPCGLLVHARVRLELAVYELPREQVCGLEEIGKHTSELQSHSDLVCRLLLEKKKK